MATDAEQIATIKSQTLALIAELTAAPKPSYTVGGRTFSWNEYLAQLRETIAWCDTQISGSDPFELEQFGI